MSYYPDNREYVDASRPRHSSTRRINYENQYHEERRHSAPRLPALDYDYEGHGERRKKPGLRLEQTPRSSERAFRSPLLSPASILSRKSSRDSFSDYDDVHAYNSHQRALTFPQNESKDDVYFDVVAQTEKRKKMRNKTLLYAGLACVTTVAASNNVYQATKAHMGRQYDMQKSDLEMDELMKVRKKGIMMDLFSVGVGAISINNCIKGWKRYEALKKAETKEAEAISRRAGRKRG